ncbi:MAG: hypothetical protein ABSG37_09300 [Candidatus Limnocylindrales bacterium]|jgi:hypothetical protein
MPASARFPRQRTSANSGAYGRAAMLIWPRLNPGALERCAGEPRLIADYVAHRTSLSTDVIVAMLERSMRVAAEPSFYFG